jgi:hypothetical protein
VTGMIGLLERPHIEGSDDPGVAPVRAFLARQPLAPDARVVYYRFWVGRETHQAESPELTRVLMHAIHMAFVTPQLAFLFSANHEPERWMPLHETPGASFAGTFTMDGRAYGVFAQSSGGGAPQWFEEQFRRIAPPAAPPPSARLGREEIHAAVKRALRVIDRPDLLRDNPLVDTPLVTHPAGDEVSARQARAETLSELIRGECEGFLRSPRDRDLFRVLHQTYFAPAAKQRAIAAELGLSFITYRRHLATGIQRLADRLWSRQGEVSSPTERRGSESSSGGPAAS